MQFNIPENVLLDHMYNVKPEFLSAEVTPVPGSYSFQLTRGTLGFKIINAGSDPVSISLMGIEVMVDPTKSIGVTELGWLKTIPSETLITVRTAYSNVALQIHIYPEQLCELNWR